MHIEIPGLSELETLGAGGSGVVYRARQDAFDRIVAVKVIRGEPTEGALRRFDRERRAMGRLSEHPFIVAIYSSGLTSLGEPYFVMPLYTNGSIADMLEHGPVPPERAHALVHNVAEGLAFAHDNGVLHRDIKPGNILIAANGDGHLADFGIAKIADASGSITATQTAVTPLYAAPELFNGSPPSVRTDIYSLGATLFAMLNGEAAFSRGGGGPVQALVRASRDPLPDLTVSGVPVRLMGAVAAAMDRAPEQRPQSVADFVEILDGRQPAPVVRPPAVAPPPAGPTQWAPLPGETAPTAPPPATAGPTQWAPLPGETAPTAPPPATAGPTQWAPLPGETAPTAPPPATAGPTQWAPLPGDALPAAPPPGRAPAPPPPRRRGGLFAVITALAALALIAAVAAYVITRQNNETTNPTPDATPAATATPEPGTTPLPTATPTETVGPTPTPTAESNPVIVALDPSRITASASSTLSPTGSFTYGAGNTLDDNLATAWNHDGTDTGLDPIGQELRYSFDQPVDVTAITIVNGYASDPQTFFNNHRVAQIEIRTPGEPTTFVYDLADTSDAQVLPVDFDDAVSTVTLRVSAIYPGERFVDVAVTEVDFSIDIG